MRTVSLMTVGCKVNQVDTDDLRRAFAQAGFAEVGFGEPADVVVVNSCTVTARADRDSRRLVRRARRGSPDALVVLTGCLASRDDPGACEADVVAGNDAKDRLVRLVVDRLPEVPGDPGARVVAPAGFGGRTRAFLKVQDGCDNACTYCIVPSVRGPSRSVPLAEAVRRARELVESGYAEIVLTGIHLGRWGADLAGRPGPVDLLRAIERDARPARIRLSSIEPLEVTGALLDWLAGSPAACAHLHLPLQSGDAQVLARMDRPYAPDDYRKIAGSVAARLPGVCLGADVLVGFPGETDAAFSETLRLATEAPLSYLHVFSYSPRPGTPAAEMDGAVPVPVVRERTRRLRQLSARKRTAFARGLIGGTQELLVETEAEDGSVVGTTRNYLRVTVPGADWRSGELHAVRITGADAGGVTGEPV